jgi:hypothetical protein
MIWQQVGICEQYQRIYTETCCGGVRLPPRNEAKKHVLAPSPRKQYEVYEWCDRIRHALYRISHKRGDHVEGHDHEAERCDSSNSSGKGMVHTLPPLPSEPQKSVSCPDT